MANLKLTLSDLLVRVSDYLGMGNSVPTDSDDLSKCKDIVARGYRQFLYPLDSRTGDTYEWSFLRSLYVLPIKSGQWKYQLPEDYSEMLSDPAYEDDSGYSQLSKITPQEMLDLRATLVESYVPYYYAVVSVGTGLETGSFDELWLYPEPDSSHSLQFFYKTDPQKPDATTDYLVGGVRACEAILECCLAVADTQENKGNSVHVPLAEKLVQTLIVVDSKRDNDTTIGNLYGTHNVLYRCGGTQSLDDIYPD